MANLYSDDQADEFGRTGSYKPAEVSEPANGPRMLKYDQYNTALRDKDQGAPRVSIHQPSGPAVSALSVDDDRRWWHCPWICFRRCDPWCCKGDGSLCYWGMLKKPKMKMLLCALLILIILLLIIILPIVLTGGEAEEQKQITLPGTAGAAGVTEPLDSSPTAETEAAELPTPYTPKLPNFLPTSPGSGIAQYPVLDQVRRQDNPLVEDEAPKSTVIDCSDSNQFACADDTSMTVGSGRRCDGLADCLDGSDEAGCTAALCKTAFHCPAADEGDVICVRGDELCDGADKCPGREDETVFCNRPCNGSEYRCAPSQFTAAATPKCVPRDWLCDGDPHCPDGDDERLVATCGGSCSRGGRLCRDPSDPSLSACLPAWQVCNGEPDCADASDEQDCGCESCAESGAMLCGGSVAAGTGVCLSAWRRCDGIADCPNGEDETTCPGYCDPNQPSPIETVECSDGGRVPVRRACGGLHPECEQQCRQCDVEHAFQCDAGGRRCIPREKLCDGRADCADGSDESVSLCRCEGASFVACGPGSRGGSRQKCLPADYRCDGYADCPDGSDELKCNGTCTHNLAALYCAPADKCLPSAARCDGRVDCDDYSDEDDCPCNCLSNVCTSHDYRTFMCSVGNRCLTVAALCSGAYQCPPGSEPPTDKQCTDYGF